MLIRYQGILPPPPPPGNSPRSSPPGHFSPRIFPHLDNLPPPVFIINIETQVMFNKFIFVSKLKLTNTNLFTEE